MTRARGFTIVELGIVMTLLLSLMTLMALYFARGQRFAAETETYSTVQRSATSLLRKISDDLSHATLAHLQPGPSTLIFLSYSPISGGDAPLRLEDDTGRILWTKWVGYHHDPAQEVVYRGELPLVGSFADLDSEPNPNADLLGFPVDPAVKRQPVASRVKSFSITRMGERVRVRLTTRGVAPISTQAESDREVEIQVETSVLVRK